MIDKNRLKNIELVVSDLDGTLLNSNNEIGKRSLELIKALHAKGVRFTFATGRLFSAAEDHARQLGLKTPLITLDGAMIKSLDGTIVFNSYLSKRYVAKAIRLAEFNLTNIALCHADAIYYSEQNPLVPEIVEKFGARFIEVDSLEKYQTETLEIVIAGDYKPTMKFLEKKFSFPYTFGLNLTYYKSSRRGNIYFLEIRKHGSGKGEGLAKLLKHLKININNVAVMGDWYNDRTLFNTDAYKVAVANAVDEIKFKSNFITSGDNNNDGIAEFLELLLKTKE